MNLTTEKKNKIKERDGWQCVRCGSREQLTIDHVQPLSEGGTNDESNLRTLCFPCNVSKANKPASWFVRFHNWIFSTKTYYEFKNEIRGMVSALHGVLNKRFTEQEERIKRQEETIAALLNTVPKLSGLVNTNNTEIYSRIDKLKERIQGIQDFQGIEWVEIEAKGYRKTNKIDTLSEAVKVFNSKHHSL